MQNSPPLAVVESLRLCQQLLDVLPPASVPHPFRGYCGTISAIDCAHKHLRSTVKQVIDASNTIDTQHLLAGSLSDRRHGCMMCNPKGAT